MRSQRQFFAILGLLLSWLSPLVVFFLLLELPAVRDLVVFVVMIVAIYNTYWLVRGLLNPLPPRSSPPKPTISKPITTRDKIAMLLDELNDEEIDELYRQAADRISARRLDQDLRA
ncbi:MAG: hypothetical protein MUF87_17810 [Anaerolineae bacterium]|nr:hypothetical protein [Anaerolineae bacterium]